jgi:hypothetical protein
MCNITPFTLRIFVADGDPDGLRIVERSNWIGKAVVFPRFIFPIIRHRDEFQQTGVYLLMGPRTDGDGETIFIGEGDPIKRRIDQHYIMKDFWTRAVFIITGQERLSKAHVRYLESRLVARAKQVKRMHIDNEDEPVEPLLSESEKADMDVFLQNVLSMLPVLGVNAFESMGISQESNAHTLKCSGYGLTAIGRESAQGFQVLAGSEARVTEVPSLRYNYRSLVETRSSLQSSGILVQEGDHFKFTQDYTFGSPSMAAAIVLGRPSNGRTEWKDKNGRTLKDIQEEQVRE